MALFLKKAARGELPGQRKDSGSRGRSSGGSPSGESSPRDSPNAIPPEPVQQDIHGDFSLNGIEGPLQVHNLARANKRCKALEWHDGLARDAASYAKTLASTGILEHSGIEGENLYVSDSDASFEDAVDSWLANETKYNGKAIVDATLDDCGDFTQCVWSDTRFLGMGKSRSKDGKTYIVARYAPPGNVNGKMPF